jgi:hypothetical protein
MSWKKRVGKIVFCLALGVGSITGAAMRPEEVEALMCNMNKPKIVHTLNDDNDPAPVPAEEDRTG